MVIRNIVEAEYDLLEDFLYEAIFKKEENMIVPREIINRPELKIYIDDFWRKKGDYCLVAEEDQKVIGAVWVRVINGYGHVEKDVPEFAISLYKPYRGKGIGTKLMEEMLQLLRRKGYKKASLAVQKENYAYKMYQKVGFYVIDQNAEEYIMCCDL